MAIETSLAEIVGKIRLELGDNQADPGGMLPNGRNFSDEELTHFYTEEGSHFWRGVARAFEAASAVWAQEPVAYQLGPEKEQISTADKLAEKARKLRVRYGHADAATGPAYQTAVSGAVKVQVYPADGVSEVYG